MGSQASAYDKTCDYLASRGVVLHALSNGTRGACCPFHSERTPSFTLYPDGHYHCYGCAAHSRPGIAGLLSLIQHFEGVDILAAKRIADANHFLDNLAPVEATALSYNRALSAREQEFLATVAELFRANYRHQRNGKRARDYLLIERGIKGPYLNALVDALIGFAPTGYGQQVANLAPLYPDWYALAKSTGILNARGRERLSERLIFLASDRNSRVTYYQARSILPGIPSRWRFLNPEGIAKQRFDLLSNPYREGTFVVEGFLKGLAVAAQGWHTIALNGSNALSAAEMKRLQEPIIVGCDLDENEVGQKAQERVLREARSAKKDAIGVRVAGGYKDWDKALKEMGVARFTRDIEAQLPALVRAA